MGQGVYGRKTRLEYLPTLGPADRYRDGDGPTIMVKHNSENVAVNGTAHDQPPLLVLLVYERHNQG